MQGQRGTIDSISEMLELEFECGPTPSNPTEDQHLCWNNVRNPTENQMPDYILSPSDINPSHVSSINHEWQNLSGWSLGEPSSSNTQNEINGNEQKRELGWSSSISDGALAGPRLENRRLEPSNALSLDDVNTGPLYGCSSNSELIPQNLNLNEGLTDSVTDNSPLLEHPSVHKSNESVNNGFHVEDTNVRPGSSLDTRRMSCKRKAVEGNSRQSSDGGGSSYSQHIDGSAWHAFPTQPGGSSRRSIPPEQLNARLGLGMEDEASESVPDAEVAGSSESFRRNFRLRINSSNQQNSIPPSAFSTGRMGRHSGLSSSSLVPQRFHPVDDSLNLRSPPLIDNAIPQSQPLAIHHAPALPRNRQSFRWSGGSSLRNVHPPNSIICEDRDSLSQADASSRSVSRNILEHPVFGPSADLRNLTQNPSITASSSANLSIPGNVASSSRAASNLAANPSATSAWGSRPNPPQHPRRLSEYARRSLFSPGSDATGGPSNNYSSLRTGPPTTEPRVLSSGAHPRSSSWLERQGDSDFGFPYSLRTLAVAGEGNSRLVSELRNVLGLMRRGGNLRFEDVMVLDQSMFSEMADIHDRHRDMRLDVDNMSYEELLALEERIGNVSTGLSEETILKLLKQKKRTGSQHDAEPCCVCQEEYKDGDHIGTLDCGHDFHGNCIKKWLMHKNLCPICKTTGLAT